MGVKNFKTKTVTVGSKSINNLALPNNYKEGISEYIWNGFDAGASCVEISYDKNQLESVSNVYIKDNGKGINYNTLDRTFERVLESQKKGIQNELLHGSRGKGRFSYIKFAHNILWETVFRDEKINYEYAISSNKSEAHNINVSEIEETNKQVGTTVTISDITNVSEKDLNSKEFREYLKEAFEWYLYLNKENNYKLILNGCEIDYSESIDQEQSENFVIKIEKYVFEVCFIKWVGRIKNKYYSFFLDNNNQVIDRATTSYNNKNLNFPHSVYVKSKYFDNFNPYIEGGEGQENLFNEKNRKDKIYKDLLKEIKIIVQMKYSNFVKQEAPKIVDKLEAEGIFPKFTEDKYGHLKREDLKIVLTEVCAIQPQLFNCKENQKKTIVGFLNLLLDSNERGGVLNIMENILSLTPEERKELNDVLKKTTLSRIIKTVSLIQNRLKVIEALKILVHDMTKFTNERDHIQKIVEENYWLFGEQYHMVTADKNFEKALTNYIYIIDGYRTKKEYEISNPQRLRRPDIFMCRSRSIYFENSTEAEENIIVELKAPNVVLDIKISRQIEDYMRLISKEGQFNSTIRNWKFIMVSEKVDDDIKGLYNTFKDKGKRFLIHSLNNYEVYAMTWDDVFKNFEINHKYILERLEFDKSLIKADIESISDKDGREYVNQLTDEILNLKEKCNIL